MKNSHIAWTDHTFNPWEGCTKVSAGCAHCYAETRNARFGGGTAPNWGKGAPRRRTSAANWKQPYKWNKDAAPYSMEMGKWITPPRPRVFCASLADWLDDEVPIQWLADLLMLISTTPNLDWLLLTKRPENWKKRMSQAETVCDWTDGKIPANIWVGTSVENQEAADLRIPQLLEIPAKVRFLSCEPLLGPLDLQYPSSIYPGGPQYCCNGQDCSCMGAPIDPPLIYGINWVIVGGESGHKARICNVEWIRDIVKDCRACGVAPFVKQLGACPFSATEPTHGIHSFKDQSMEVPPRMLWHWNHNDPKGGDLSEWPEDLRVQESPISANP